MADLARPSTSSSDSFERPISRASTSSRPKTSLSLVDTNRFPSGTPRSARATKEVPFGFGQSSNTVGSKAYLSSIRSPTPSSRPSLAVSTNSDRSEASMSSNGSRIPKYSNIISHRTALTSSEADLWSSRNRKSSTSPSPLMQDSTHADEPDPSDVLEALDDFSAESVPRPQSVQQSRASTPSSPRKLKRRSYVPVPAPLNTSTGGTSIGTVPTSSAHSAKSSSSSNKTGGIFFGSSDQAAAKHAARVASASTGTGKVLSDLQFELSTARGALETTKSTLRISQKAVENLTRDKEELQSHGESLRLENEGLSKMLQRKERMLQEAKQKAEEQTKVAEERDVRATTLEAQAEEMSTRTSQSESAYEAIKSGFQSAKEGWERQLAELRKGQEEMQRRHFEELNEALQTQQALRTRLDAQEASDRALKEMFQELETAKDQLLKTWTEGSFAELSVAVQEQQRKDDESHAAVAEVVAEMQRLKRLLREHDGDSA